jgi:type IV pilus assembly protein PilW
MGLVDLMVGLAIGMLAMLVILQVAVLFESRRKATLGSSDAQINGINAMALISRDLRIAGYGLGPPDALGCSIKRHYQNDIADLLLQPVTIIDGASGAPDTLRILSSAKQEISAPARLITPHPFDATTLLVNSTLAIAVNDVLVLQEVGKPCTMLQATAVPVSDYKVIHDATASAWNTTAPATLFPAAGYGIGAAVINLGAVSDHRYAVNAGSQLEVGRYLSASDSWDLLPLASNIVSLQAQYGFDARPGVQATPQVTWWSSTMLDADGNGTTGDNGDLRRLLAIRLAIVARSDQAEPPAAGGCNTAVAPEWLAGAVADGQLTPTSIDVSSLPNWRCYRYRVMQSIVPLRNLIWSQQ